MTKTEFPIVRFIGGPADGHVEQLPPAAKPLPEEFIWFVNENLFRLLDGRDPGAKKRVTSVAIYDRQRRGCEWHYIFVGAISPCHLGSCFESRSSRTLDAPSSHTALPHSTLPEES